MDNFGSVLEAEQKKEQQRALRALLQNPLITANGRHAESFILVRRHAETLNRWLRRRAGWSLFIDRETARLRKNPARLDDPTRGARGRLPFSRRRYALFCLALAALGQGERQTTLSRLFANTVRLAASDQALTEAGLQLDPTRRDHRRDLVDAVNLMLELGLMRQIDGDAEAYLGGKGDVLYTVNRTALSWVPNLNVSPGRVEETELTARLEAVTREPRSETPEGRNQAIRHRLTRILLDDPILYYDRLDPQEREYLNSQRGKIVSEIEAATGLHGEVRREGIAMVDETGELTDFGMPAEGTEGHLTLLLAQHLAQASRKQRGPVGRVTLTRLLAKDVKTYGKYWRKDAREPENLPRLLDEALTRLRALDLIEIQEDGILPLPAIARYDLNEPKISRSEPIQGTLL